MATFPFFQQLDASDCGVACLRMVSAYHGVQYPAVQLRALIRPDREGTSIFNLNKAAEHLGFRTMPVRLAFDGSEEEATLQNVPLPAIVHWDQRHFLVVYKISSKKVWVADPASGKQTYSKADFLEHFTGMALLLEPGPQFGEEEVDEPDAFSLRILFNYLKPYRRLIIQLIFGLFAASILQLIFPFLTQAIVDTGIQNQDIGFIYLILLAQLMLFVSQMSVSAIQSWILLHIGVRVNVHLVHDFLQKLLRLPLPWFQQRMTGDLLQRIQDHERIERFLTSSSLTSLFSFFNLLVFGAVLWYYDATIFLIFAIASIGYLSWVLLFLRKRRVLDRKRFEQASDERNQLIEMIQGVQEIKLQQSEQKRRQQWSATQSRLFRLNMKELRLAQYQDIGAASISQLKDILISFFAAKAVIDGTMTLGMMLAIQYIIGQLNGPLLQMIQFIRSAQDARISAERLSEIHGQILEDTSKGLRPDRLEAIHVEQLSFKYQADGPAILTDLSFRIPQGKITAIVGPSGQGKTTLIKLLLGFFQPSSGNIQIGDISLKAIDQDWWRSQCAAVLQDGYIFSDTIENNIIEGDLQPDRSRMIEAARNAQIHSFIDQLPLHYQTIIGSKGIGLSQGQLQRILLARAFYKKTPILFLDEATNALDLETEDRILSYLKSNSDQTIILISHRPNIVEWADQVISISNEE